MVCPRVTHRAPTGAELQRWAFEPQAVGPPGAVMTQPISAPIRPPAMPSPAGSTHAPQAGPPNFGEAWRLLPGPSVGRGR